MSSSTTGPSLGRAIGISVALASCATLFVIPINDPWLGLTMRGFALACAFAFLLTKWRPWLAGGTLALSVLVMSPSFIGEKSGVPGMALVIVASAFSIVSQLKASDDLQKDRHPLGPAVTALLLLAGYMAFLAATTPAADRLTVLAYCIILIAAVAVFRGDPGAVRAAFTLLALFIAILGYAWLLTVTVHSFIGLDAVSVPHSVYDWRSTFNYATQGQLTIVNSQGFFGLSRVSNICGEPGTWALYSAMGAGAAGVAFADKPALRTFTLTGAVLAILSSQSSGAILSFALSTAMALTLVATRNQSDGSKALRVPHMALAGILLAILPIALSELVRLKSLSSAASIGDRGLGFLSGIDTSGMESRISLVAAFAVDGVIIVLPMVGLLILAFALRHNPFTFAFAVFLLPMGFLVQPIQWHLGIWFATALLALIAAPSLANMSKPLHATMYRQSTRRSAISTSRNRAWANR